jgi:hypothetical protein
VLLCQVVDDGVVNFEESAFPLLAFSQNLFRLSPLTDIEKSHDCADGFTFTHKWVGPILHWKAAAIFFPKNITINMDTSVFMEAYINRTLLNGKWTTVLSSVVFERIYSFLAILANRRSRAI